VSSCKYNYFGEVIESSITEFVFQTWHWKTRCPFGSVVLVENQHELIYGLVYQIKTGSDEPGRQPYIYQKSLSELEKEQPHIFSFLKTTVSAIPFGYKFQGGLIPELPQNPCLIHAFVRFPEDSEVITLLTTHYSYVQNLFALQLNLFNIDALLYSLLCYQKNIDALFEVNVAKFLSAYSSAIGNDYRRLHFFVQKVSLLLVNK